MLTTKRYDYLPFDHILIHPDVSNHRPLDPRKVAHYEEDIYRNGLLEPLVVWEKATGHFFLVGGFHRLAAIQGIRKNHPGYFDRVDTRVVAGSLDEIRALNLKLNADRLDTKITDFFDVVVYLNNANWTKGRIAQFLDRSVFWVEEILRYAPSMDAQIRTLLAEGKISWAKAKRIGRAVEFAPAGKERDVIARELEMLRGSNGSVKPRRKPLTFRSARKRLLAQSENRPKAKYAVAIDDLLSLVLVLEGRDYDDQHLERVRNSFPGLLE